MVVGDKKNYPSLSNQLFSYLKCLPLVYFFPQRYFRSFFASFFHVLLYSYVLMLLVTTVHPSYSCLRKLNENMLTRWCFVTPSKFYLLSHWLTYLFVATIYLFSVFYFLCKKWDLKFQFCLKLAVEIDPSCFTFSQRLWSSILVTTMRGWACF